MRLGDLPKPDEVAMVIWMLKRSDASSGRPQLAREYLTYELERSGMPENRFYFILLKWTNKGYWEYGTNVRGGWFTDKGLKWAQEVRQLHRSQLPVHEQELIKTQAPEPVKYPGGGLLKHATRRLTEKYRFTIDLPTVPASEVPTFFGSGNDLDDWKEMVLNRAHEESKRSDWFPRLWLFDRESLEHRGHIAIGIMGPAQGKTEVHPQANEVWAVASPDLEDAHQFLVEWVQKEPEKHAEWWSTRSTKMKVVGTDQVIQVVCIWGDEPAAIEISR